ncbi:MAG: hypothetical protein PHQ59_04185 [Candidatus Daviesbacteria bacterium]|nr:hypothetical protein [Candidatus Daviesbacteria bacterium]
MKLGTVIGGILGAFISLILWAPCLFFEPWQRGGAYDPCSQTTMSFHFTTLLIPGILTHNDFIIRLLGTLEFPILGMIFGSIIQKGIAEQKVTIKH